MKTAMFRVTMAGFVSSHPIMTGQETELSFDVTVKTERYTAHAVGKYVLPVQATEEEKVLFEQLSAVKIGDKVLIAGDGQLLPYDRVLVWIDTFEFKNEEES